MGRTQHLNLQRRLDAAFPGLTEAVAAEFGYRPAELLAGGKLASRGLAHARSVAMWLAYQRGDVSYETIAEMFGVTYPSCRARVIAIANRQSKQPGMRAVCARIEQAVRDLAGKRSA